MLTKITAIFKIFVMLTLYVLIKDYKLARFLIMFLEPGQNKVMQC